MSLLIRGGTVVTAEETKRADVYCADGAIQAVGEGLEAPAGAEIVDAGGALVMPGGIDPHTHMELPFMGTVTTDDFFTGPAAALAGGTNDDHRLRDPRPRDGAHEAWRDWMQRAAKAPSDYSFHVAITNWNEKNRGGHGNPRARARGQQLQALHGLQGRDHAGRREAAGELRALSGAGARCVPVHAENGELVWHLQQKLLAQGITGPEGQPPIAPAGGGGRGGQPRHPHRPGAEPPPSTSSTSPAGRRSTP